MLSHAPACGKIPRHARASVQLAGESWNRFLEIWDALADPDGDISIEQFGPFYARFRELQRLKVPFDEGFIRRIEAIALSCRNTNSDPDQDGGDLRLADGDPCDEDEFFGVMACDQTEMESQRPAESKWDKYSRRFFVSQGPAVFDKPKAGANLAQHAPGLAKRAERMALPRLIEPVDKVRSKGGEITHVRGTPGPGDENRRYTP